MIYIYVYIYIYILVLINMFLCFSLLIKASYFIYGCTYFSKGLIFSSITEASAVRSRFAKSSDCEVKATHVIVIVACRLSLRLPVVSCIFFATFPAVSAAFFAAVLFASFSLRKIYPSYQLLIFTSLQYQSVYKIY